MTFYERKINSVIKVKKICIPSGKGLNEQIAQKTQFYCVQFLLKVGVKLNLESGSDLYIYQQNKSKISTKNYILLGFLGN